MYQVRKVSGLYSLPLSMILIFDFGVVPTVWYILELFRQCGIFWSCSDSVVYFVFHFIPTICALKSMCVLFFRM